MVEQNESFTEERAGLTKILPFVNNVSLFLSLYLFFLIFLPIGIYALGMAIIATIFVFFLFFLISKKVEKFGRASLFFIIGLAFFFFITRSMYFKLFEPAESPGVLIVVLIFYFMLATLLFGFFSIHWKILRKKGSGLFLSSAKKWMAVILFLVLLVFAIFYTYIGYKEYSAKIKIAEGKCRGFSAEDIPNIEGLIEDINFLQKITLFDDERDFYLHGIDTHQMRSCTSFLRPGGVFSETIWEISSAFNLDVNKPGDRAEFCEKLELDEERDLCYFSLVEDVRIYAEDYCDKIINASTSGKCWGFKGSMELCLGLDNDESKFGCLKGSSNLAKKNMEDGCSGIPSKDIRDQCYFYYSIRAWGDKAVELCNLIDSLPVKEDCYFKIVQSRKGHDYLCSNITDTNKKDSCYLSIVPHTQSNCDLIVNEIRKQQCFNFLRNYELNQ